MEGVAQKAPDRAASDVLIGIADSAAAEQLIREMRRPGRCGTTQVVLSLDKLRRAFASGQASVLLVDDRILSGRSLADSIRPFESRYPVIVLASIDRQREAAELVARGQIEFVARQGDFLPLAAGLIERRLRALEAEYRDSITPRIEWPSDIGEVFRHEINNPLTGILGNAELVLAHREAFTAAETQRLETVVDLAVRLRETIRRLGNSIEMPHKSAVV
jgi:signal transduction histidine kinase